MRSKTFPYKYLVLGVPVILSLLASVPAIIALATNNKEYQASARIAEAKIQLNELVDLVLKREALNLNLVELGFRPEGKVANVYGVNPHCFPKFKNTNLIEVKNLKEPIPLFKWTTEISENLELLKKTFSQLPCSQDGAVVIYALYVDESKNIQGWTMNLKKEVRAYGKNSP